MLFSLLIMIILAALHFSPADAQEVGRQAEGMQANGESLYPPLSYDGRYVAFFSIADNLVDSDDNEAGDIFVHDMLEETTSIVSIASNGRQANGESTWPSISGDGRYVVFTSQASNLVGGDDNGYADIFVYDMQTRVIELVSLSSRGDRTNGESYTYFPSISYDGRYVVFMSDATNLVEDDTNVDWDVFVRDREEDQTVLVSKTADARPGNGASLHAVISGNGRYVAFNSKADNLVPGDTNGVEDVFLHDRETGSLTRVSFAPDDQEGNGDSDRAAISFDGRRVAFSSIATNLVQGDFNDAEDVFVADLATREIDLVSVGTSGSRMMAFPDTRDICCLLSLLCCVVDTILDRKSVMAPDGNTVVFRSDAPNLVGSDFNYRQDIFVRNIAAGTTERVSVSSEGRESNGTSVHHGVSFDGRYIAFSSTASNLVENDTNGMSDIFVHDRATRVTKRASIPSRR